MQPVLGDLLLRARLIDEARLGRANDVATQTPCTLAHALVKLGLISERALAQLLSQALNLRVVDPTRLEVHESAIAALAGPVARRLRVLPVRLRSNAEGEFLYVVMSDPSDQAAVSEVAALTGRDVVPAVAEERALERALRQWYGDEDLRPAAPASFAPTPEVVMGVLEDPPAYQALGIEDDGSFFTESTEEIMNVYSRTMNRVAADADDNDLAWLKERKELVDGPAAPEAAPAKPSSLAGDDFEDATTHKLALSEGAIALETPASSRAMLLPDVTTGDLTVEPASQPRPVELPPAGALRAPLCVVVADGRRRATLRAHLARQAARLFAEESLPQARALGKRVPLGYIVVVAPAPAPAVSEELRRLKEIAGSPGVVVIGGDPAFQVVPGVDAWLDDGPGEAELAAKIIATLRSLGAS